MELVILILRSILSFRAPYFLANLSNFESSCFFPAPSAPFASLFLQFILNEASQVSKMSQFLIGCF
jgi:hypothetical protein